jgi:hypothetical protein
MLSFRELKAWTFIGRSGSQAENASSILVARSKD